MPRGQCKAQPCDGADPPTARPAQFSALCHTLASARMRWTFPCAQTSDGSHPCALRQIVWRSPAKRESRSRPPTPLARAFVVLGRSGSAGREPIDSADRPRGAGRAERAPARAGAASGGVALARAPPAERGAQAGARPGRGGPGRSRGEARRGWVGGEGPWRGAGGTWRMRPSGQRPSCKAVTTWGAEVAIASARRPFRVKGGLRLSFTGECEPIFLSHRALDLTAPPYGYSAPDETSRSCARACFPRWRRQIMT